MAGLAYHGAHTTFVVAAGDTLDRRGYNQDVAALEALPVWSGADGSLTLWDHQKQAIAFCAAYGRIIGSMGTPEAGLIKMPTGTGKSGVVAVVARCLTIFNSVVCPTADFLPRPIAQFVHRRTVRAQAVGYNRFYRTMAFQRLPYEGEGGLLAACPGDVALEDLAFLIDRAPQIMHLATDLHVHLIKMPIPVPEPLHPRYPLTADVGGEHWTKTVPPEAHRLVANIDPPLEQQVLDVPQ